jgi:hypothetical protein
VHVVIEEGEIGHNPLGNKRRQVPDITVTITVDGDEWQFERLVLGGKQNRAVATQIKFGIDIVVKEEDASTARRQKPADLAAEAEREKTLKYRGWRERNRFDVVPFAVTNRGTLGLVAQRIFDLLREISRRLGVVLGIGELKKELSCTLRRADNAMKEVFVNALLSDDPKKLPNLLVTSLQATAQSAGEHNLLAALQPQWAEEDDRWVVGRLGMACGADAGGTGWKKKKRKRKLKKLWESQSRKKTCAQKS